MASCARFREKLETIRKRIGLTNAQTAFALAFFIGSRIAAKDGMAPAQAATLALEVMAGTSRMAPLPATSPESPQPLGNAGGPEVAVADIMQMIVQGYAGKNSQHVPTLISAAAALAGEQARLATGKPTSEDGWARNEDANKLLYRGGDQGTPTLWAIVRDAALRAKSHSGNLPAMRELTDRIMMAAGSPDFPPMSVPDDYLPMDPPLSSCVRFRQKLEDIRQKNKLSYADMALALAKTIAGFIESMPPRYSPASMTTMAMEVMTGLTRFSPSKAPADMAAS